MTTRPRNIPTDIPLKTIVTKLNSRPRWDMLHACLVQVVNCVQRHDPLLTPADVHYVLDIEINVPGESSPVYLTFRNGAWS